MRRPRRKPTAEWCAADQETVSEMRFPTGNALYFCTKLGIADGRADSLVERLLHWQWPDGGWNCDRHPEADTSSFMETLLPMLGLAVYARKYRRPAAVKAARAAGDVFLRRRLFKRLS